ncbi:Uncharacterized protein TPAR_04369 [Tolypocladium paradoxum]|uniref:Uncharacterized protein n=1 Tax=Tolypocladium paradoxum TaxID=94208 RepID=A0A2S4KZ23_9HYPO|nr:Uncharacterized protein TPAR_04369 [Tolypocladium paradoxum]
MPSDLHGEDSCLLTQRATAARILIKLLGPLLDEPQHEDLKQIGGYGGRQQKIANILAAIQALVSTLWPGRPLFAAFHDGQVHHPLGGAAYAFEKDLIGPLLSALANDEAPIVSTLVVFCYAFLLARELRNRAQTLTSGDAALPAVLVDISFVDTAPVCDEGLEINGVQYQRCYRDVPVALAAHMADYDEVLC